MEQPRTVDAGEIYTQAATGFAFPAQIGHFRRSVVTEYNQDKTDVSAGYDKITAPDVAATIYVYPAPSLSSIGSPQNVIDDARMHLCTQAWEGIKADIARAHPDAELIEQDEIPSPSATFTRTGRRAVFKFTGNFRGAEQALRSEADLFCYVGNEWLVAYRTTAPVSADFGPDLKFLMRNLPWPTKLAK